MRCCPHQSLIKSKEKEKVDEQLSILFLMRTGRTKRSKWKNQTQVVRIRTKGRAKRGVVHPVVHLFPIYHLKSYETTRAYQANLHQLSSLRPNLNPSLRLRRLSQYYLHLPMYLSHPLHHGHARDPGERANCTTPTIVNSRRLHRNIKAIYKLSSIRTYTWKILVLRPTSSHWRQKQLGKRISEIE
jgi:hypothetical protein